MNGSVQAQSQKTLEKYQADNYIDRIIFPLIAYHFHYLSK